MVSKNKPILEAVLALPEQERAERGVYMSGFAESTREQVSEPHGARR